MAVTSWPALMWSLLIYAVSSSCQTILYGPTGTWNLGSGFQLHQSTDGVGISQNGTVIWATVPGKFFVSASAGNDSVIGSNGAFNITQIDFDTCSGQTVESVQSTPWQNSVTGEAIGISGSLLGCGAGTAAYSLYLWVPADLTDRVAFYLNASPGADLSRPLNKLFFRYASHANEDFYGAGAQASFASLKNQSIPIFSREQGVGRGDQPLTNYENENGTFGGGNKFTTYTAIASYVSTDGNVFYLSENSTAYANFDFTEPDAVTVRYDYLSVNGMFMRAANMFDAVEGLTAYTGRMPALPKWVDEGAILGIQGGQAKVNTIIEQGLELNCPIAAVWLQDWCGTRTSLALV